MENEGDLNMASKILVKSQGVAVLKLVHDVKARTPTADVLKECKSGPKRVIFAKKDPMQKNHIFSNVFKLNSEGLPI